MNPVELAGGAEVTTWSPPLSPYGPKDWAAWKSAIQSEVTAEWAKLSAASASLWMVGCVQQHTNDIDLEIKKTNQGQYAWGDFKAKNSERAKVHAGNVATLTDSCRSVTRSMFAQCETYCRVTFSATNVLTNKTACETACTDHQAEQARSCMLAGDDLSDVYANDISRFKNVRKCRTQHCEKYASMWGASGSEIDSLSTHDPDDSKINKWKQIENMKGRVEANCQKQCVPSIIEKRCKGTAEARLMMNRKKLIFKCYEEWESEVKAYGTYSQCSAAAVAQAGEARLTTEEKAQATVDACVAAAAKAVPGGETSAIKGIHGCIRKKTTDFLNDETTKCTDIIQSGPDRARSPSFVCERECKQSCDVEAMVDCTTSVSLENKPGTSDWCSSFWNIVTSTENVPQAKYQEWEPKPEEISDSLQREDGSWASPRSLIRSAAP